MNRFLHISIVVIFGIAAVSCSKQDRENTIISQENSIDRYISSLGGVQVVRNNGANRVIISSDNSAAIAERGDSLYIRFAGYIFSNGRGPMFITNDTSAVGNKDFVEIVQKPYGIRLGSTPLVKGLDRGLEGVTQGEHCYIIFSAKYGFNNTEVYVIPKLSPLFYEIWVDKIAKNGE